MALTEAQVVIFIFSLIIHKYTFSYFPWPISIQLFTNILVEYIQQVIAFKLVEFIQSNIKQSLDFSIRGMGSRKPDKSMIF